MRARLTRSAWLGVLVTLTVMNYASLYRFEVAVNPLRFLGAPPASISGDVEMP